MWKILSPKNFFVKNFLSPKKFFFVKNFLSPKMSPDRCKKIFLRKKKNLGKKNFFEKKFFLKKKFFEKKFFARVRGARARSWGHPGSNDTPQVGIWGQKISFSRLARARARCAREVLRSPRFQRYPTSRYLRPKNQFFAPSARARARSSYPVAFWGSPRTRWYPTCRPSHVCVL